MAHYTITYSCRHEGTIELFGPTKERVQRISYLETQLCPDCYKKAQEAEIKEAMEEFNPSPLEGSEKQIAWAEKIRYGFIMEAKKQETSNTQSEAIKKAIITFFAGQTSAKFWIDNRDKSLTDMVRDIRSAIMELMK